MDNNNKNDLTGVEFAYLADHPEYYEKAARWIYDEFINGIRLGISFGDVLARYSVPRSGGLPVRLIALFGGGCAGTVSLVENDLRCRDYTPWLASLVVEKEYRSRGFGRLLIEQCKNAACDLGFKELYLRTETAGGYYRKLGWSFVEVCTDEFGLEPEVFRMDL